MCPTISRRSDLLVAAAANTSVLAVVLQLFAMSDVIVRERRQSVINPNTAAVSFAETCAGQADAGRMARDEAWERSAVAGPIGTAGQPGVGEAGSAASQILTPACEFHAGYHNSEKKVFTFMSENESA